MKHLLQMLPSIQDNTTRLVLQEIIKELDRIKSIPAVTASDVTKVRDAVNKITGKVSN